MFLSIGRMATIGWILGLAASPVLAQQDEKSWSLELGYDYASRYLFRGVDALDGEPVHQPRVVFKWSGFSASSYGYLGNLSDAQAASLSSDDYFEIETYVDYTWTLAGGKLSLTTGALFYTYEDPPEYDGSETTEVYVALALDTLLSPKLTVYRDVDTFDSTFATLSVGHGWELGSKVRLDLSAAFSYDRGFNTKIYATSKNQGANDLLLGVNVPWKVTDALTLRAQVQHSVALDILDEIPHQGDHTIYTLGGSYGF